MKKILILQMRPEDETAQSEFEAIIRAGQINKAQVDRIRVERLEVEEINLDKFSAIIAGGSPFDVSLPINEKSKTQLEVEAFYKRLFDKVIPNDFPFFGVCSGNGLLGSYTGTTISRKFSEPVGHVQVKQTEEGKQDKLLKGLPLEFTAFVGHKEACEEVPIGAILLATSAPCPVQMFRIKENIYATQFHPEADEEEFLLRIEVYKDHGYFPPEEAESFRKSIKGVEAPEAKEILRRFIENYS